MRSTLLYSIVTLFVSQKYLLITLLLFTIQLYPFPYRLPLKDSKLLSLRELSVEKHYFWNFYESLTHMVFSGISQHPSEGFPGGGAVLRPTGRPRGGVPSLRRCSNRSILVPNIVGEISTLSYIFWSTFNDIPTAELGLRLIVTQIWLSSCTLRIYPQICSILKDVVF